MPLTHHKIVAEDAFFVLTQRLKNALPEDIKKATELARKTASVVENANSEAKRMVTDAQNEAQHLVGDARSQADRAVEDARSRSERMVEDSRREAERILADAQQHAEQLVSDHTITQTATQTAEKTEQVSLREAEDLRRQADDYAFDILDRTETILNKLMTGVQQGKNQIQQPAADSDNSYNDSSYGESYSE